MFNYVCLTYIIQYSSTVNRDHTGLDFLPQKLDNGYSYRFDFFTNQCPFTPRCAFSLTAAAPTLASWFYQSLPLFLIPFSTTAQVMICCICVMASVRDLGKCSASRSAYAILHMGCYPKCSKVQGSWKRSVMIHTIHNDRVTHPLFY